MSYKRFNQCRVHFYFLVKADTKFKIKRSTPSSELNENDISNSR